MAVAVANQWTLTSASSAGDFGDFEIVTGPAVGNWLIAVVSWSVNDGSSQTVTVGDPAANWWQLLYSTTAPAWATQTNAFSATLGTTEVQNVQVWACPAVHYEGWAVLDVYVAFSKILARDVGSVCVNIVELSGMGNGSITVDSVTVGTAAAATSLSITAPAPSGGADVVMVAAANTDLNSATTTFTAAGWSTLTQVSANKTILFSNYANPDLRLTGAWRETTVTQTAAWTSSAACNWAGLVVAVRQTGVTPAQPNASWPATQWMVGLGAQAGTPPPAVRYTDLTQRLLEWSHQRGVPYEMGSAQADPTDLRIRNDDGAFTPRPPGSATANAAGTTTTLVCASTAVSGVSVSDYFQLKNSTGTLKEYTVFRVTGVSTVGATTTITFVQAAEPGSGVVGGGAQVATASGDVYGAVPIDLYIPYQILMTWQGKTYVTASGTLADLPQQWLNPHWGEVAGVALDPLMQVAKVDVQSPLRTEVYRYNPTHYWPLDDPQGSPVAQNIGSASTQLVQQTSKFGAGSGTAAFGVSTQNLATAGGTVTIAGDAGTGWQATGMTSANLTAKQGFALVGQGNDFPPVTTGVTLWGLLYVPSADQSAYTGNSFDPTVVIVRSANPSGSSATLLKLSINHTNNTATVTVWDKVTKVSTATTTSMLLGQQQWTNWALSFDQTHWYLWNGGGAVTSGTCNLTTAFNVIDVGGEADRYITGFYFGGIHSHVAVYGSMLSDSELTNLSRAVGGLSLSNDHLVRRSIEASGWVGARIIGPSAVGTTLIQNPSGNIVDQCGAFASDEDGVFFADAAGQLQFRSDARLVFQTSVATLGDGAGELPYLPQWGQTSYAFDDAYLYTAVKVANTRGSFTQQAGQVTTNIVATAPSQYGKYAVRVLSRPATIINDWQAWLLAWWLLNQYQGTKLRVDKLVMDAYRTAGLWQFLLSADVADVVTVNRRPIGAPMISDPCRILHIEVHAVPPEQYEVTLTMGAVRPPVYVCNDPVLGIVGSGNTPGSNVIGM